MADFSWLEARPYIQKHSEDETCMFFENWEVKIYAYLSHRIYSLNLGQLLFERNRVKIVLLDPCRSIDGISPILKEIDF